MIKKIKFTIEGSIELQCDFMTRDLMYETVKSYLKNMPKNNPEKIRVLSDNIYDDFYD